MEYVDGVTIKEELENGKVFEEQEAVDIVLQIAARCKSPTAAI